MNYVRDSAVVGDNTVYVGTEMRFKETSAYRESLKEKSGHVPSAFVVGISRSGIAWEATGTKGGVVKGRYSIEMFAKEFHVVFDPKREKRNIAAIELFESFGGEFHGPNIETATIPLCKMFELIEHLKNA